jgi:hypothetical protein
MVALVSGCGQIPLDELQGGNGLRFETCIRERGEVLVLGDDEVRVSSNGAIGELVVIRIPRLVLKSKNGSAK